MAGQNGGADRQTLWEFWRDYTGPDKLRRLMNSYAVGIIGGGCTGTMISPHVFLSAAHCGGPGPSDKTIQFFHTDEDAGGPDPRFQTKSEIYYARSFHWQGFVNHNGIQDADFMLWWVENGSDGLPPGIKYGHLELTTGDVSVGDEAYSFWWNPFPWPPGEPVTSFDTLYHSIGRATMLGTGSNGAPLHFTDYDIGTVGGASGSSIIKAAENAIIGTTAIGNASFRRAADSKYTLSLHDGEMNAVLNAVEYDLLMTGQPADFQLLHFGTPLQREQWRAAIGTNGQVTLARPVLQGVPAGSRPSTWAGHVGGARVGPSWYRACWNSPWNQPQDGNPNPCPPRTGFFLENFEDGQLNTLGVSASAGSVLAPGSSTDSVDLDDGGDDHNGNAGHSFFSAAGAAGITFSFNQSVLGSLPKRVGIVWTDGDGDTQVEAFDSQGGSLGMIGPLHIADQSNAGTDSDDRFFGFTHQGGISALKVWNTAGGIEVDHLQYELNALPSYGDSLSHGNARFEPNSTYRITAVVYGLSPGNPDGRIALHSFSGNARQTMQFQTAFGAWKRVTGRVTLGDLDDYRLILGAPRESSFLISSIAIVKEGTGAAMNFQTGAERDSWEYIGSGHPTSWGYNGAGDFSGVVTGPSNVRAGGLFTYPTLTGDVNGDGRSDLIFVGQNWSGPGLNIRTKIAQGDGNWTAHSQAPGDGSGVHSYPALTGDVNGDGRTDLIFAGQGWDGPGLNIRCKISNGDGTWRHHAQVLGDGTAVHTYPALSGDVNGDGRTDLVFVGQGWSGAGLNVRTKLSNGDGTWSSRSQVLGDGSGVHSYPTLAGDVNGDGKTDLIFVGLGWDGPGLNIRVKISNGDGTWTHHGQVPGDGSAVLSYPVLTGDFNGDGKTDLGFVGQGWSGAGLNIRTKLSNGDGTWVNRSQVLGDGPGVHTYPALTGDVNGDGRTDIVFAGQGWSGAGLNIRAKLSNGDGAWTNHAQVLGDGPGVHSHPALAGDTNADGRADVVFVGEDWSGPGLNVRTKQSNGDGTWTASGRLLGDSHREWILRQRNVALEAGRTYDVTFDARHVSGDLSALHSLRVENLSAVPAGDVTWRFAQQGEGRSLTLRVGTGAESGHTLTFGTNGAATYLVDNIRVQRVN
jgi:hypothetical protein